MSNQHTVKKGAKRLDDIIVSAAQKSCELVGVSAAHAAFALNGAGLAIIGIQEYRESESTDLITVSALAAAIVLASDAATNHLLEKWKARPYFEKFRSDVDRIQTYASRIFSIGAFYFACTTATNGYYPNALFCSSCFCFAASRYAMRTITKE